MAWEWLTGWHPSQCELSGWKQGEVNDEDQSQGSVWNVTTTCMNTSSVHWGMTYSIQSYNAFLVAYRTKQKSVSLGLGLCITSCVLHYHAIETSYNFSLKHLVLTLLLIFRIALLTADSSKHKSGFLSPFITAEHWVLWFKCQSCCTTSIFMLLMQALKDGLNYRSTVGTQLASSIWTHIHKYVDKYSLATHCIASQPSLHCWSSKTCLFYLLKD